MRAPAAAVLFAAAACLARPCAALSGPDAFAVLIGEKEAPPPPPRPPGAPAAERRIDFNGVSPEDGRYKGGYSSVVEIMGFTNANLCAQVDRKGPINGHKWCPDSATYSIWGGGGGGGGFPSPEVAQCWIDSIHAFYDGKVGNAPGTQVWVGSKCEKPPNASSLRWAEPGHYDWRYGGIRPQDTEHGKLWPQMKQYIEDKVTAAGGKRIVLYAHSGGTILSYAFLMAMTPKWRKAHIHAYLPVVPVFGGTTSSLQAVVTGWNHKGLDLCIGRQVAMGIPSVLWMWPRPATRPADKGWLWNSSTVLVSAGGVNYTASDLDKMLADMGLSNVAALLRAERTDLLDVFAPPMVDTYAFYGFGVSTLTGIVVNEKLTPEQYGTGGVGGQPCPSKAKNREVHDKSDFGDGVGTLRSTSRASQWGDEHKRAGVVNLNIGYEGMSHCHFCTAESKADHECVMTLLSGEPLPAACKRLFEKK